MTEAEVQEKRVHRASVAKRAFVIAALVYGALIPGVLLVIVTGIAEQQDAGVARSIEIRRGTELIEDCTNPGGECYQRGQQSTADAVGDIGRVVVLASACAASLDDNRALDVPERTVRIQRCILAQLDKP